ncbi:TonB-dependent receptor family protein [Marinobacter zhanjiangensis]|uniref:TonB-dependent receptor n=1 Tax=Marinobacter zhanjiangensis TaxID=578215 RepID=A0ABQ3AYX5_9GAMM|nr:TonB-dependent receptor [Marinobacter zhanjiangensis]GGY71768.1 TonB-dependent receptor [Marinobacter zhanjiangensis]
MAVALVWSGGAIGQEDASTSAEAGPDITVTAPRLTRDIYDTPAAVSVVNQREIRQGEQRIHLDESLEFVPGIYLQNRENYAQGQRISSRGFGARAPFGIRGLHIRVDGIPYTLPDGQAQIDAVDLASAEQIQVIRGPSSVLYGNAAGGVIDITTADGRRMRQSPVIDLQGGSHGLMQAGVRAGGEQGDWFYAASASALTSDGYREQSEVEKYLFNGKLGHQLDDDRSLIVLLNLLDTPKAQDPSGLTREAAEEDPRQAREIAKRLDSGQTVDQQLVGTHYSDQDFGGGTLDARVFYSWRDFEQQLPFPGSSLINYQRDYYGGSLEYGRSTKLVERPFNWVIGMDLGWQEDDRGRNSVNPSGEVTGTTGDEFQQAQSTGVFAQGEWLLTDKLGLSAGVRHDRVAMEIDDDYLADGFDDSGDRTFREWSGSLGLSYQYRPAHQWYATVGNAFETPTFAEFARPDGRGGFNPEIEPQQARNYEVGARGLFDTGLEYDLALFSINVDDELIPFEISGSGRTFYRNAGRTSRDGLEAAISYPFLQAWEARSSLTLARYRFDRYTTDGGDDYAGNDLPGLPQTLWNGAVAWQGLGGRFAEVGVHYVGDFYADDANTEEVDSHWRFDLKGGESWRVGSDTTVDIYGGIRNLFDEDYYENVRINASRSRYYEPAPGRTFYAGVKIAF